MNCCIHSLRNCTICREWAVEHRQITDTIEERTYHRVGPLYGPPIPPGLTLLRRLPGHPTGPYRRHP
jgi:hypothetical protein